MKKCTDTHMQSDYIQPVEQHNQSFMALNSHGDATNWVTLGQGPIFISLKITALWWFAH